MKKPNKNKHIDTENRVVVTRGEEGWLTWSKAQISLTPEPDSGGRKISPRNLSVRRKKVFLTQD